MHGFVTQSEEKSAEQLIEDLKRDYTRNARQYTVEQQGVMMVKIMDKKKLIRHSDVAEILGVSRSYVSIRIAKAMEKYPELPKPKRKMGRPRNRIIELEKFIPDQTIPIRLVVKNGSRTSDKQVKEYLELAIKHWPEEKPESL